ncbi:MAG TPA: CAP domain-containing protein [Candidatus Dormibacteraeota bacterium]
MPTWPRHHLARPARLSAALAVMLTATACATPAPPGTATFGSATELAALQVAAAVVAADELVYTNRYAQAASAFSAIVGAHPEAGLARADFALCLAYRRDLGAARTQAQRAVALAPGMARAHAVLGRIEDWTDHLAAAVAEGRRAVELDSADAIGHLFLAEALADTGDFAGSRGQLATAASQIDESSPAYLRAELHREEGNLGRDAGDVHAELQGFTAAFQAQPGWVERPAELATAYLDSNDLVGAHNAIQKALDLTPDDATLLAQLGRVAMLQPDYATADAVYGRLSELQPVSSSTLELAAHARFADTADLEGAVALLERALTADPTNETAAAYLVYLERDVGGDQALGLQEVAAAIAAAAHDDQGPAARPRQAPDVAAVQAAAGGRALAAVNAARAAAGLPAVSLDPALSVSAATHCFYWLFNNNSPTVAGLGIHLETPGLPGFSGVRPGDRDVNFGWQGGPVGEDITHTGDAVLAVAQWVNSVYHRFPLMAPDLSAVGYGDCGVGPVLMEDMEFGFGVVEASPHAPVVYPGDRQQRVPDTFSDNELPDPVPAGKPRITGYPVTVTFDPGLSAAVDGFTLAAPDGTPLPAYRLAPDQQDGNTATLLPVAPLRNHTRYTARIVASVAGATYVRTWSFVTE